MCFLVDSQFNILVARNQSALIVQLIQVSAMIVQLICETHNFAVNFVHFKLTQAKIKFFRSTSVCFP